MTKAYDQETERRATARSWLVEGGGLETVRPLGVRYGTVTKTGTDRRGGRDQRGRGEGKKDRAERGQGGMEGKTHGATDKVAEAFAPRDVEVPESIRVGDVDGGGYGGGLSRGG